MAEANLIKKDDLARAREIDFTFRFGESIKKLVEALGVTRMIPKVSGTNLKAYKATGELEPGKIAEGEIIPLSHYKTVAVTFAEIVWNKWRKATSAEAISEKGRDQAVNMTNDRMLKDVQKGIRKDFFDFLTHGTGRAAGETLRDTMAQSWGQLQVLFEDDEIEAVHFVNPLDIADYLGRDASLTTNNAFGMTYLVDFLGLGTVFFNSSVPRGKVYSTAKDNLVLYYVDLNDADLAESFEFTIDETGLIGIHESPDYDNMTVKNTVVSGTVLFAERIDGVVIGTIGNVSPTVTLDESTAEVEVGDTVTITATTIPAGETVTWTSSDTTKATVAAGVVTGVAEGEVTITASITVEGRDYTAACAVTVKPEGA